MKSLVTRLSVLLLALVGAAATAKEMPQRLGVGYANQFGLDSDLPSIAMRYYPNADYGFMGAIGVDTEKNNSRFGAQAKIMKIIFGEDNLNFYTGAGAGLVSQEVASKNRSGFELAGFVGCEFFWSGLENLGVNFETGVAVTSISDEVRFRTMADHPLRAGIFFYF